MDSAGRRPGAEKTVRRKDLWYNKDMFFIFDTDDKQQNKEKSHRDGRMLDRLKAGRRKFDTQELDYEEIAARQAEMKAAAAQAEAREAARRAAEYSEPKRAAEFRAADPVAVSGWEQTEVRQREHEAQDSRKATPQMRARRRAILIAAIAAAVLLALCGIYYYMTYTVSATVITEGKARIAFDVNHRDQVLEAEAINKAGKEVLNEIGSIEGRPDIEDVLTETEEIMHEKGYLEENEHLTYSIVKKGKKKQKGGEKDPTAPTYTLGDSSNDKKDNDSDKKDDSKKETTKEPTKATTTSPGGGDSGGSDTGGGGSDTGGGGSDSDGTTPPTDDSGGGSDSGGSTPPADDSGSDSGGSTPPADDGSDSDSGSESEGE